MKIGIDYNRVINRNPEFWSNFTKDMKKLKHKIHIITGMSLDSNLMEMLNRYDIKYDRIFSITDYHFANQTDMVFDNGLPYMDDELWDRTKAEYCKKEKIDVHYDDSGIYGKYFKDIDTIYFQVI